jgi:hypothetical protein
MIKSSNFNPDNNDDKHCQKVLQMIISPSICMNPRSLATSTSLFMIDMM